MRLGAYDCNIKPGTKAFAAYRSKNVSERHRHRFEVNNRYRRKLQKEGLIISGVNEDLGVVRIIEIADHLVYSRSISSRIKKQGQQISSTFSGFY